MRVANKQHETWKSSELLPEESENSGRWWCKWKARMRFSLVLVLKKKYSLITFTICQLESARKRYFYSPLLLIYIFWLRFYFCDPKAGTFSIIKNYDCVVNAMLMRCHYGYGPHIAKKWRFLLGHCVYANYDILGLWV